MATAIPPRDRRGEVAPGREDVGDRLGIGHHQRLQMHRALIVDDAHRRPIHRHDATAAACRAALQAGTLTFVEYAASTRRLPNGADRLNLHPFRAVQRRRAA
ncbi:hypothetical protein X772_08345 [Mesorhizobium sp. LSJC280B00]|nr:hypothetical protein X772_08345 [Mesorhizobium sp. LSJC280B00]